MIRIYLRIISIRIRQFFFDFLGVLVAPVRTLSEIAERSDWGIPMVFLFLACLVGLPIMFGYSRGSWTIGAESHNSSIICTVFGPFIIVFLFFGVYVFMRLFQKQKGTKTFIRLLGYTVVPSISWLVVMFLLTFLLLQYEPCRSISIFLFWFSALLALVVIILTVRLLWLVLRMAYKDVSGKNRFLCLLLAIIVVNLAFQPVAAILAGKNPGVKVEKSITLLDIGYKTETTNKMTFISYCNPSMTNKADHAK